MTEPLGLFLKETILECIKSALLTGRFGRLVVVGVGRGRLAALSLSSCSANSCVTFSGLTVWQASQMRKFGGLCKVQISHVHPLINGEADLSGVGCSGEFGPESDVGTAADDLGFAPLGIDLDTLVAEAVLGPESDLGTVEGPPGRDHSGTGGRGLLSGNAPPPLPVGNAAVGAT